VPQAFEQPCNDSWRRKEVPKTPDKAQTLTVVKNEAGVSSFFFLPFAAS
jgi:hypothetical protein